MSGTNRAVGHVVVKNVGGIPASNVNAYVRMRWGKTKESHAFRVPEIMPRVERSILPRDKMIRGASKSLPIDDFDDGIGYIYVWGIVFYADGFGKTRLTRFCHRYPAACVRRRKIEKLAYDANDPRSFMARMVDSRYEDEVILPKDARHHQFGNEAT